MNHSIAIYKNICFVCVKGISPRDFSFTHTKQMLDREKNVSN